MPFLLLHREVRHIVEEAQAKARVDVAPEIELMAAKHRELEIIKKGLDKFEEEAEARVRRGAGDGEG